MNFATVCSGIEAPSVAWEPLGWKSAFFSEIEKFPSAVLAHHWPDVPNYGDMTKFKEWPDHDIELICGGTPCQSFSVAGLRKGLDDPRGNLTLTYLSVIDRYRPRWVVWENVPGVLSADGGRAFGAFLGGLAQLGYGFAYRVLDAQYFGVPQRRRRVFVVGYLGDMRPAAAVLFERHSLSGHPAPGRETGQGTARGFAIGPQGGHRCDIAPTLDSRAKDGPIRNQVGLAVAHPLLGKPNDSHDETKDTYVCYENHAQDSRIKDCGDLSPQLNAKAGTGGNNIPLVMAHGQGNAEVVRDGEPSLTCNHEAPIAFMAGQGAKAGSVAASEHVCPTVRASNSGTNRTPCVAFHHKASASQTMNPSETCPTLDKSKSPAVAIHPHAIGRKDEAGPQAKPYIEGDIGYTHDSRGVAQAVCHNTTVRRLTPRECERLQGFPDDFTRIDYRSRASVGELDIALIKYIMRSGCSYERAVEVYFCPDGPRYKALGNSMAVPVVRWIGERIQAFKKTS